MIYLYLSTLADIEIVLCKQIVCLPYITCRAVFNRQYAVIRTSVLHRLEHVRKIGIKIDLRVGEQLYRRFFRITALCSGAVDIVIVDSVAALVPKAEIDGDMGDSHVGLQARLMSQALRKLTPVVSKNNCVVIFINQLREKVG